MMCHCRLIDFNQCNILVGDVDNKLYFVCVWQRVYGKSLYLLFNNAVNLKLLLNFKYLIFKKREKEHILTYFSN